MDKKELKKTLKKIWYFIWEDDSVWSWLVNIVLAFVLIKFIVYPGLGFLLGTGYPVVAVVSESMEHNANFDEWWEGKKDWYMQKGITKEDFIEFSFKNGFNKGDIMVLLGAKPENLKVGDVIVFVSSRTNPRPDPIIHRLVVIDKKDDGFIFKTKGDHNSGPIDGCNPNLGCTYESDISSSQILGKAVIRIPFLGYVKIAFVELLKILHIIK